MKIVRLRNLTICVCAFSFFPFMELKLQSVVLSISTLIRAQKTSKSFFVTPLEWNEEKKRKENATNIKPDAQMHTQSDLNDHQAISCTFDCYEK